MRMNYAQSLICTPLCSWVYAFPRIYFNKDVLAQGERFKILAYTPVSVQQADGDLFINISKLNQNGELTSRVFSGVDLKRISRTRCALAVNTGRQELLEEGPYIAQVVSRRQEELWGEHRFYVAHLDEYRKIWKYTFGDEWDKPIYWDHMEKGQGEELLRGLSLKSLLSVLPKDFEWGPRSISQFLGHLVTAFMADGHRGLPFGVMCESKPSVEQLPHVDLTKLIWLLNATGPVLRDIFFLSGGNRISIRTSRSGVYIDISEEFPATKYQWAELSIGNKNDQSDETQPAFFDVIRETVGQEFNYKLYCESSHHVHLGVFAERQYPG